MLTISQRIAIRFSLTIAGIVLILGLLINLAFLGSWWKREQQFLRSAALDTDDLRQVQKLQKKLQKGARNAGGRPLGPRNTLFVSKGGEEVALLEEHIVFGNVAYYEEAWYIYGSTRTPDEMLIVDISPAIENQIDLLWITFIAMLLSSALGYAISLYVVQKSLRDLHLLAQKVQTIDIDSLQQSRAFSHLPAHDEIQIVAHALEKMTKKVDTQVATIKQFVANVSHEFKTPLMSLQSTIDLGEKTKQYESVLIQSREQIAVMHRLLDTLTLLTRIQKDGSVEKEPIQVAPIVHSLCAVMQEKYPAVNFVQQVDVSVTIVTHQGFFERIVSNLLDNAGKFTEAGGTVTVFCDTHGMSIADTGSGISAEQLDAIREPFWQGDAARGTTGFGLGLSLVQQLVNLLDWDIIIKSSLGKGTTVILKR